MEINQKNIENAFYSDGYKLGMNVTVSDNDRKVLFESVSEMYAAIDNLIEGLSEFAEKQNQRIDCKKGCEWCCHQPVFALDYELEYLNDFISHNFSEEIQTGIKKRAENKNGKLSMLSETELLNSKYPCPLLQNGTCMAYQARPMSCRIYLSSNVNSCLNFYHQPQSKTSIPALLNLSLRTGQMMNEGFKAALKTTGIKTREFRIEEKLSVI
ncbi:MAG TPA: YkgJ family cysteine cluster protein [Draconibacterium sp.]|nr:YkgJ family cysteine cluster protein [Draconibacterium sp.]